MVDDSRRVMGYDHGFRVGIAGPVWSLGVEEAPR